MIDVVTKIFKTSYPDLNIEVFKFIDEYHIRILELISKDDWRGPSYYITTFENFYHFHSGMTELYRPFQIWAPNLIGRVSIFVKISGNGPWSKIMQPIYYEIPEYL